MTSSAASSTAVKAVLRRLNLKPVKKILFTFDPFHESVRSIRTTEGILMKLGRDEVLKIPYKKCCLESIFLIKSPSTLVSNPACRTKIEVVADRSPPVMDVDFKDGDKLIIKTELLTTLEVLHQLQLTCTEKAPPPKEEPIKTLEKKKAKKGKKK